MKVAEQPETWVDLQERFDKILDEACNRFREMDRTDVDLHFAMGMVLMGMMVARCGAREMARALGLPDYNPEAGGPGILVSVCGFAQAADSIRDYVDMMVEHHGRSVGKEEVPQ